MNWHSAFIKFYEGFLKMSSEFLLIFEELFLKET